jgi:acetylornithine deacetylase
VVHLRHAGRRAADAELKECRQEVEDVVRRAAANDPFLGNNPPTVSWEGFQAEPFVLKNHEQVRVVLAEAHQTVFGHDSGGQDLDRYGRQSFLRSLCGHSRAGLWPAIR